MVVGGVGDLREELMAERRFWGGGERDPRVRGKVWLVLGLAGYEGGEEIPLGQRVWRGDVGVSNLFFFLLWKPAG